MSADAVARRFVEVFRIPNVNVDVLALDGSSDELAWVQAVVQGAPNHEGVGVALSPVERVSASFIETAAALPRGVHRVASMVGYFAGAHFLCGPKNDDEDVYFAARSATDGKHRVHALVPRFSTLAEEGWPSIADWLASSGSDGALSFSGARALPAIDVVDDPSMLSRRAQWLVCALAGLDAGGDEFLDAPSVDAFANEAGALATRPHLALYWLLHHFTAGNASSLRATFELTERLQDPWVVEVRQRLWTAEKANTVPTIGHWNEEVFERFEEYAPEAAIE